MEILPFLEELEGTYKTSVKPHIETGLTDEAQYHLRTICTNILGISEELKPFIPGRILSAYAFSTYKQIIKSEALSRERLDNLEVSLAQARLAVSTGNSSLSTTL